MTSRLIQHGLTAGGAATAVTVCSWTGGQGGSRFTSRIASRSFEGLVSRNPQYSLLRQQIKPFSTKATDASAAPSTTAASTTAASSTSTSKSSKSFVEWYEGHLEAIPVKTKMVTGSILWGLGDAVAQIVPHVAFESTTKDEEEKKDFVYDWTRTGRAVVFGFLIHAPTSHVHFNFLEWMTVRAGVTGLGVPVFKAFMEQFVYWSWISNSMYHGAMGAMQGMSPNQIYDRISDVLWDTQKAQWAFWVPVQLLNFRFIPVRHQLNVVLVTSIVWSALLSAWYPPVETEKEETAAGDEQNNEVVAG